MFKKILKIALIVFICVSTLGIASCTWLTTKIPGILQEAQVHVKMYNDVEQQLGFKHATPYAKDRRSKMLVLTEVSPGKPMDRAGFKENDRYDPNKGTMEFFNLFVFNQGKQVMIPILRDGQHLDIPFSVPVLQLEVDPYELHYPFFKRKK